AVLALFAWSTGFVDGFGKFDELTNEQIQSAVVVVIEPNGAGGPSGSGHASLLRHVREGAVPIIVVKDALTVLRHVKIRETVAIVVSNGYALSVPACGDSCLFGDVGESAIAIIS